VRRHYCVTYDVSDDKRRDRIFKTLHGYGDHAQFSVFFCKLNDAELAGLRSALRPDVNALEDQVLLIDMGTATTPLESGIEVIGKAYAPPGRTVVV
jgi:CRISPR-associated protein Cas2